jgi:hypothetical protein
MREAERERPVGARANAQPEIGLAGEPDMARIDDKADSSGRRNTIFVG